MMLNAFPEAVGLDDQRTLSVCPATCGLEAHSFKLQRGGKF